MNEKFTLNNEACQFTPKACCRNSAHMLPVTDWLADLPDNIEENDLVEVQFKNTRKVFFRNVMVPFYLFHACCVVFRKNIVPIGKMDNAKECIEICPCRVLG